MEHKGTMELESSRLILRRLVPSDAEAMYRNWASDPEVTAYLTWPPHRDLSVTEQLLQDWDRQYGEETFYQWAIVPKDLGEPIGTISVVALDSNTDTAELGYCIGKPWWHQGYTSEALSTVMSFLFYRVKVHRLEARHDTKNPNSGAVMQKCGLRFEGVLRSAGRNNQGVVDTAVYSILAEEFPPCTPL